jgi:hypothetical protein
MISLVEDGRIFQTSGPSNETLHANSVSQAGAVHSS